ALAAQALDLVADGVRQRRELLVRARDTIGADLALDAPERVLRQRADRADRVAQLKVAEALDLLAERLERAERHERAHHVVGALEDREDPDVAQDLLI